MNAAFLPLTKFKFLFAEICGIVNKKNSYTVFTTGTKKIQTSSYGDTLQTIICSFVVRRKSHCSHHELCKTQIGIGLLVLQQLSGINGILFYASNIFKAAGKYLEKLKSEMFYFIYQQSILLYFSSCWIYSKKILIGILHTLNF